MAESIQENDQLSRAELQIEQEKLRLERERIALEQERLQSARDRIEVQAQAQADSSGRLKVSVSTLVMSSMIAALVGGILGALSTSMHTTFQNKARLRQVMETLATKNVQTIQTESNRVETASGEMPVWLKTMKPRGAHAGISLVFIQ